MLAFTPNGLLISMLQSLMNRILTFTAALKKCLKALTIPLLFKDLRKCFTLLYGKETVTKVLNHIEGTEHFYGLPQTALSLNCFKTHEKLIEIYEKNQEITMKSIKKTNAAFDRKRFCITACRLSKSD